MTNLLAILTATVAAFVVGGTYYAVLGDRRAAVSGAAATGGQAPPWELAGEVLRCLILAAVVAGLAVQAEIDDWSDGLLFGTALWIGFPLVLWAGAVIHERTPWKLAAIHAGDWLLKLLVVALIVSVWQ
jgi:Protein of unknown function (DUF1761)